MNLRDSWACSDPDIDEPPTLDDEAEDHCDDNIFENEAPAFGFFSNDTMDGGFRGIYMRYKTQAL